MAFVNMKKRKREEYEMQLLGFHSRAVNATLNSLIQEEIKLRCEKMFELLEKKYKPKGDSMKLLKQNKTKLMEAYYLGCRSYLSAIENCINKLTAIPDNVLLNEDEIQANQWTIEEFNEMKQKLEDLQQRLKKAVILNAALKEEMEIIKEFDENINTANTVCDVIENGTKYHEIGNTLARSIDSYQELQRNFEKLNNLNPVRNKKRCLKHTLKSIDTNNL